MNKKMFGALLLAVVLSALAWKISVNKAPQTELTRSALYLNLLDQLNDVTRIELQAAKTKTTLVRGAERWTVANRDNFPADAKAIKRLLLQLADLQIVEAKTALPENYGRIGVAAPGAGSDSLLVELHGAKDNKLLAVIVGKVRDGGQKKQRYVRRADEAQSWLVNGTIDGTADSITWLDARIADIDPARVRHLEITPQEGPAVVIEKARSKDSFFDLRNVPAGREARSKALVSSLGALLLDLRFNSVGAATRFAGVKPLRRAKVQTFDGLLVQVEEFEADGKTFARFDFDYDPKRVHNDVANDDTAAPPAAASATDKPGNDAEKESVQQEAARLKERVAGWVYELPDYKTRLLSKRLDDLVQAPGGNAEKTDEQAVNTP